MPRPSKRRRVCGRPACACFGPRGQERTPEGPEYSMDYKGLLQYLHDHDYDGYVSTEYEGNRFTLPGHKMMEKEQVAAQQAYIRKCLKEIQG